MAVLGYYTVTDIPFLNRIYDALDIKAIESPDTSTDESQFTFLDGKDTDIKVTDSASAAKAAKLALGNAGDELMLSCKTTVDDITYYRLQQCYYNIPVYGRSFVVTADKEGNAVSVTSNALNIFGANSTEVSQSNIDAAVKNYLNELAGETLSEVYIETANEDNHYIYNLDSKGAVDAYALSVGSEAGFYNFVINAETYEILSANPSYDLLQKELSISGQKKYI